MKRSVRTILIAAGLLTASGAAVLAWPAPQGSPKALIKLANQGASEEQLLQEVRGSSKHYTLSVEEIVALKNASVPDAVVIEMLKKNATQASD